MLSVRWSTVLAVAIVTAGCQHRGPSIEAVAAGYAGVALQMAQHDPELVEDWRGPDAFRPASRVPVAELLTTIESLQQTLHNIAPNASMAARGAYLSGQLRALHFAARRLLGDPLDIDEQARAEFGIELSTFEPAQMAGIREGIDRVLPGPGSTFARVLGLKTRTVVAERRRQAVMEAALAACRRATAEVITLPAREQAGVSFERGLGWDAYARPLSGGTTTIAINADAPLDVSRALRLACHEGYPGHHVQQLLMEQIGWRPEFALSPGFGPHLLFTEGAAEVGADRAFTLEDRERLYRDELLPAAGLPPTDAKALAAVDNLIFHLQPIVTDVARLYLSGARPKERAIERLRNEALILNAEGTLAMIERRRARALVYGEGRRAVQERMAGRTLKALADLFSSTIALP
jgi:hypothetical protein